MNDKKNTENKSESERIAEFHSNLTMIFVIVFILLPVTAVFVTELMTDQLIYRTINAWLL